MSDEETFDWSSGQPTGQGQKRETVAAKDFQIEDVDIGVDADQVAAESEERRTFPMPLGPQHMRVVAVADPAEYTKTVYFQGQPYSMTAWGTTVTFGLVSNLQVQVRDFFLLPPADTRHLQLYQQGSSDPSKEGGYECKKFGHFLNRLYPGQYPTGSTRMPADARKLTNWLGRPIYADIKPGFVNAKRVDPRTGKPYEPRNEVRFFSYSDKPLAAARREAQRPLTGPVPMGSRQGPLPGQQNLPLPTSGATLPRPQTGPPAAAQAALAPPVSQVQKTGLGAI